MKAVILAAGRGTRLEPLTEDLPKCLVKVGGIPLLDRMIARLGEVGITDIVVVTGHKREALEAHLAASDADSARRAQRVFNPRYAEWGNFYSLLVAEEIVRGSDFIKLDADVLMDGNLLPILLAADGPAVLCIDRAARLGDEEMKVRIDERGRVVALNKQMAADVAAGESIGVERIDAPFAPQLFAELRSLIDDGETDDYYERAYERLMQRGIDFGCADISNCVWHEIDDADDLARAERIVADVS